MHLPSIYPRLPDGISTGIKLRYICMMSQISPHWMHSNTWHGEKVCQWLLQTTHTIPQLALQLVEHLPPHPTPTHTPPPLPTPPPPQPQTHSPPHPQPQPHPHPLLNLVSFKCKTGCSQGYGCCWAGALSLPMCTKFIGITRTNTSQDSEV